MPTDSTPEGIEELHNQLTCAVGSLAVEFGRLELDVSELAASALGKADLATRDAVNAVLSFRQKLDLVGALAPARLTDSVQLAKVQACLQQLQRFEDERNGLLHAFWAFVRDEGESAPGRFVRSKVRTNRKKGLTDHTKAVEFSDIRELANEIRSYRRILGQEGSLFYSADLLYSASQGKRET
jgi:hypothetical protein